MNLQERLSIHLSNLQRIADLLTKYNFTAADFDTVTLSLNTEDKPEITFHCYDSNRETVLVILGDFLGRNGWERKLQYGNEFYRWFKTIDGVKVEIFDAERIAKPIERPVQVSNFPIQLQDQSVA